MRGRVYALRDDAELVGLFGSFRAAEKAGDKAYGSIRATWVEKLNGPRLVKVWHYPAHRIELWQVDRG